MNDKKIAKWLQSVKQRAKRRGIAFNLEPSDIVIPKKCPLLDIPLYFTDGKATDNTPSIDRIDNTKGYIKGNIMVISLMANRRKDTITVDDIDKMIAFYLRLKKILTTP